MSKLRSIAFIIVLALLMPGATLFASGQELDSSLAQAEQLYRKEGAASALPEFERLLREYEESGDAGNVALTEGYIGECHWRIGNFDLARTHLEKALVLKQVQGDRYQQAKTLNVLGLLEWDLGNFDAAIDRLTEANTIGREMGDRKLEGATLNNLSMVHDELGDYQRSLSQYREVLEIYSGIDFPRGEGDTLGNIGGVYLLLGNYREAVRYYGDALRISEQLESVPAMSQDHGNLGLGYAGLGQTDKALGHFDEALTFAQQAGMRQEQGLWLRGRANAQIRAGRYDMGLEDHRAALKIYEEIEAQVLLLEALHDMGELQLALGDPVSAEQHFRRAIEIARSVESSRGVTVNLLALGDLQFHHDRIEAAEALYLQALGRAEDSGEEHFQCEARLRLAQVHNETENFEAAQRESGAALAVAREIGARTLEAQAVYLQAESNREQANLEKSLLLYDAAELASGLGDPDLLWQIEFGKGLALASSGRTEEAVEALKRSVLHIESVRDRLHEKRFRTGYLQDKHHVYLELVRLQLELGKNTAAFSTAERLRTWSFETQSKQYRSAVSLNEEQRQRETELRERIRQLRRVLDEENQKSGIERRQLAVDTFSRELTAAEREYQVFLDDLHDNRVVEKTSDPAPAVLQDILRPDEALVEYIVAPTSVMIFVLTNSHLHATSVPVQRDDLHARLELLRDLVQKGRGDRWIKPAASLSQLLIDPMVSEGWLEGIRHIYFVPHESLNYLPFTLLLLGDGSSRQHIVDTYYTTNLPAAAALGVVERKRNGNGSLLAAVPASNQLRHAPAEAEAITRLFPSKSRLLAGQEASESAFKELAGDYGYLHLATHGRFNRFNPLLSGLELEADESNDGLLEVHEILGLELGAELVTLSACETGMGSGYLADLPAGDEFVSLTRAFLQSGGSSVLATLWKVDDRSTVDLMKDFYRRLQEPGALYDKAVALAHAQRALRSNTRYEHPFYWAPFVLVGDANTRNQGLN